MNTLVKTTIIFIIIYINLSIVEYISHRWIMHSHEETSSRLFWKIFGQESIEHGLHHKSVKPDMTLDLSLLENKHSGLFFRYIGTSMYFVVFYILFYMQFKISGINMRHKTQFMLVLFIVLFYSLMSNCLHLEMHNEQDVHLSPAQGVSNSCQKVFVKFVPSFWLDYIVANHHNHHRYKSTSNFNFFVPLTDHIMGTYRS